MNDLFRWLQLAGLAVATSLASSATLAADIDWSFADHPHPGMFEFTSGELAKIETVEPEKDLSDDERYCSQIVPVHYQIYNERYPDYSSSGEEQARWQAWKNHTVRDKKDPASYCVVFNAAAKLQDLGIWPLDQKLIFCGRYLRSPENPHESALIDAIDEVVTYAKLGDSLATTILFWGHKSTGAIQLNPDVEYYVRKSMRESRLANLLTDTSHIDPKLSDEKRDFLDQAVERDDFASVLENTPPCAQ
ncbi:MAG: hypothetical protein OXR62_05180 [Ahrensia sp.]|nr:hypothetical protein [Ahrensia sp.]